MTSMASNTAASALPDTTAHSAPLRTRTVAVFGTIAIVLIGLNLRAGISGAAALFHDLQAVLGYGAVVAAIVPSVPTLCFAVAGAATSWLTRRLGVEKAILLSLVMLAGGLLLRGVPRPACWWRGRWWACPGWPCAMSPCPPSSASTSRTGPP